MLFPQNELRELRVDLFIEKIEPDTKYVVITESSGFVQVIDYIDSGWLIDYVCIRLWIDDPKYDPVPTIVISAYRYEEGD